MQHNERGPAQQSPNPNTQSPIMERVGLPTQAGKTPEKGKEKSWIEKISTNLADIVRDVDTASKMAKDEFDGDSALMRTARGAVSIALGAGMEKVTDMMWEAVWNGGTEFIDRYKLPKDTGVKINAYASSSNEPYYFKARIAHLIREGSQDLAIGALNNIIAFRSQPILQKVEAKHLLRSLAIDAGQAFLTPSLGKTEYEKAMNIVQARNDNKVADAAEAVGALERDGKNFFVSLLNLSNPVTHLGIDMVWSGLGELKRNLKEVRGVRKEKGIVGKSVDMPQKYEKKEWGNRDQGGRWKGNKDKVYYGKSNWKSADQKAQEEYELKAA